MFLSTTRTDHQNGLSDPLLSRGTTKPCWYKMVLTAVQIMNFFTQATQIGVPVETMNRLQQDGITSPIDLKDFDDEALKIVKENLQHSAGRIADPNPNANGAMIPLRFLCLAHTVKLVLLQQPSASNSTI